MTTYQPPVAELVQAHAGAPVFRVRDATGGDKIICSLCGRPWADSFLVEGRPACGPCFVRYPYSRQPDRVPPGMEMGGTGI